MRLKKNIVVYLVLAVSLVVLIIIIRRSRSTDYSYFISFNTSTYLPIDEVMRRVEKIVGCTNKTILETKIQMRGEFLVLYNYIAATKQFACYESVSYTTVSDFTFLDNVKTLVERWNGPISIAVYAPGHDFQHAIDSIAYLRKCGSSLVKTFVTFHLFFDNDQRPEKYSETYNYDSDTNCIDPPPFKTILANETYRARNKLLFPINVGRNIARGSSQTHFVLASDIELAPTPQFIAKFLAMVAHNPKIFDPSTNPPSVFVLPVFEIAENASLPNSKTELQKMFRENTAFWFHDSLCKSCHRVPKFNRWIKASETTGLNTFSGAKRLGDNRLWEPFYVGTNREPLFDEDFTWEGQNNKMVQVFEMCLMDYDFMVLDNAFLVHKAGVKLRKEQYGKYLNVVKKTNKLRKIIKAELVTQYESTIDCRF